MGQKDVQETSNSRKSFQDIPYIKMYTLLLTTCLTIYNEQVQFTQKKTKKLLVKKLLGTLEIH